MPGKTISFMKIAALVAFVHFACCAAEQTLLSIDFDQQTFPVKTLTGSWEKNSMGINVDADSRIAIQIPARLQVKNGSVRVGFLPPEYKKARIPGEPRAEDCSCALKLYAGRCFAEVTDRGLSLKRLDPTFDFGLDCRCQPQRFHQSECTGRGVHVGIHRNRHVLVSLHPNGFHRGITVERHAFY
jgi:hypothetical protein